MFYLSNIRFQFLLYKYSRFLHLHMIPAALLLRTLLFFMLKWIIFITCFLENSQNFIFHSSKWRYCKHWKTWWNIFAYSCCRWIFRIIFTSIRLFYYAFKICTNNKWCFIRFLTLNSVLVFSSAIIINLYFRMPFYVIQVWFLF